MPQRLATTILVEGDPDAFTGQLPIETQTLAVFDEGDQRHLILAYRAIRFRVCVTHKRERHEPAFVVPDDPEAPIRLDAARQFYALRARRPSAFTRSPFTPSPYHRQQLARLLAIADAARAGAQAREIAFGIVFPNTRLSTARDWKGSNEQRHTRRLTRDAEYMIEGGFWRLPCFVAP